MGLFVAFGRVLQMIFWTLMKNIGVGTGFLFQKQEVSEKKQNRHKLNPMQGFPIVHTSHIQPLLRRTVWKIQFDPHLAKSNVTQTGISTPWN